MCSGQATRPDMIRILSAALHVVLRRDMSLNRRLYAWLLGEKYSQDSLSEVSDILLNLSFINEMEFHKNVLQTQSQLSWDVM